MSAHKVVLLGGGGFIGGYLAELLKKSPGIGLIIISSKTALRDVDLENISCLVILAQPDPKFLAYFLKQVVARKIVYASTLHLYPDSLKKQKEESLLEPANDYEIGKILEEKILIDHSQKNGLELVIARITNVYGDIKNRGIIQKIFTAILNNESLVINNNGEQIRDYIFVEDIANYLKFLIFYNQEKPLEIFNISTGVGTSIKQLINDIELLIGKKLILKNGLSRLEKKCIIGDNSKIVNRSLFKPKFNLKEGLKRTYQNILKH